MKTIALLLFVLPALAAAKINWPFSYYNVDYTLLNITVTSSGQTLHLDFGDFGAGHSSNLYVAASYFNFSSSLTFNQTAEIVDSENRTGIRGTDDFTFGNENATFLNLPVDVLDVDVRGGEKIGEVGWNVPTDGSLSFIQSVLKELEEEVVVFSFDPYDFLTLAPGLITLGGRPADRCSSGWTRVPTIPITRPEDQWAVALDEFSFGYSTFEAAGSVRFSLRWGNANLPLKYKAPLYRAWGVASDARGLPCNTTLDLVFRVGETEIRLPATDYVSQNQHWTATGYCGSNIFFHDTEDEFTLPATIFQRHCLELDYAHARMGFAPRLM
ncbi:hypothetical protein M3Y99_01075400 [Aphelenchoides fujianensis]|nr:hypothetical protein M3Y99_01075400 [Aphelenchoides fujianensis]